MITLKQLNNEIKRIKKAKESNSFYDESDKFALFGYLHALLYVKGTLKGKGFNNV
tara:strand:- start:55 stop:219 length:165 start_codon:yes stop_codon:yes gene_type:complete